jgi:hypothetical protein
VADGWKNWECAGLLELHVMFGLDKVGKRGKLLDDGKNCVTDVIVEARFEFLGKATGEKLVTIAVTAFGTERAGWRLWGVKNWEAEFTANEEAVLIGWETVILEASWKGVERDASCGREE